MSKVLIDRELLVRLENAYMEGMSIYGECEEIRAALSQQTEPATVVAPFDLNEFARRAGQMMAEHDFHGFEPIVLAIAEELLGVQAEPAPAQDELKPCPFCGETLRINNTNLAVHSRGSDCLLRQQPVVMDDPQQVKRWNARPAQTGQKHDSDCSTNNRGAPDLLGPCDCSLSGGSQ